MLGSSPKDTDDPSTDNVVVQALETLELSRTSTPIQVCSLRGMIQNGFYQFSKYCDTVWTCCGKVNASSFEKLQRRAARIIVNSSNNEQAMSSLTFDSLADRHDKHVLKFVKKCIEGKASQFFSNYFKSNHNISKRIAGQQHHLHLPRFKTECGKNFLYVSWVRDF